MAQKCSKIKSDGQPCKAYRINESQHCFNHAPEMAKKRAIARKKGGKVKTAARQSSEDAPKIRNTNDLLLLIDEATADAWQLEHSERRAKLLCTITNSSVKALGVGALEERMTALEDQLAILRSKQA